MTAGCSLLSMTGTRVLTLPAIRAILRLRLIIQTKLIDIYMRKSA